MQERFELSPNAQIWPRALNTAIGGTTDGIYLIVSDLGTPSGQGLDFINGQSFLERFGDNLTLQQPRSYDTLTGSTPCSTQRTSRWGLPRPTLRPRRATEPDETDYANGHLLERGMYPYVPFMYRHEHQSDRTSTSKYCQEFRRALRSDHDRSGWYMNCKDDATKKTLR